jgi:hypothetical protein
MGQEEVVQQHTITGKDGKSIHFGRSQTAMADLNAALQLFDATEGNLKKLMGLWSKIEAHMPSGPAFGGPPEYDELCFTFRQILTALPAIDGFRVEDRLLEYDEVGQMRFDAAEIGEIEAHVSVERAVSEQGRQLQQYRLKLHAKRRELVRERIVAVIDEVDNLLPRLRAAAEAKQMNAYMTDLAEPEWSQLKELVAELDTLIGSGERPSGWSDIQRHLHFRMVADLQDIHKHDWPAVKAGLRLSLYSKNEPVPVAITDLGDVVASRPKGHVPTKLKWSSLSDEDFERLMFTLISDSPGYENPEWLQQTKASDKGRDLSVTYVESDPLAGVRRYRVIIQCKHWLSKSVSATDVSATRDQMELWQPPRVDRLIFATSGRFTADAISLVEKHNQSDRALAIYMWPDSHLERLLAARPHLIGQFMLKRVE